MPGGKGSGRPLAMDTELDPLAVHFMFLYLGNVVSDIIDHLQPGVSFAPPHHLAERPPNPVGDALAVRPGIISGTTHCRQIGLPFRRIYRCAGQLAVRHLNTVLLHGGHHLPDVVSGGLMPQPPRAAVNH